MAGPDEPGLNDGAPALDFAFEIRAAVGPILRAGVGRLGQRQHIAITGGTVRGPRLIGRILPGGSDWVLTRPDGASVIDAHYTVQADDGTPIYVHNRGLRVSSAEVLARLQCGEPVAPHEMYFRSAPVFDAPDGPHGWLSDHLFVATLARLGPEVQVRAFVVR
ncbi:MAG: DUF3237 domain-containing protein [Rhizobacter sp.]|nr:DUF3237 domain-containing protein [Rhizobacter sp.]